MMVDLIGGLMDGESINLDGQLYPGMVFNVMHETPFKWYSASADEQVEPIRILQYRIDRIFKDVAFAKPY